MFNCKDIRVPKVLVEPDNLKPETVRFLNAVSRRSWFITGNLADAVLTYFPIFEVLKNLMGLFEYGMWWED